MATYGHQCRAKFDQIAVDAQTKFAHMHEANAVDNARHQLQYLAALRTIFQRGAWPPTKPLPRVPPARRTPAAALRVRGGGLPHGCRELTDLGARERGTRSRPLQA